MIDHLIFILCKKKKKINIKNLLRFEDSKAEIDEISTKGEPVRFRI